MHMMHNVVTIFAKPHVAYLYLGNGGVCELFLITSLTGKRGGVIQRRGCYCCSAATTKTARIEGKLFTEVKSESLLKVCAVTFLVNTAPHHQNKGSYFHGHHIQIKLQPWSRDNQTVEAHFDVG